MYVFIFYSLDKIFYFQLLYTSITTVYDSYRAQLFRDYFYETFDSGSQQQLNHTDNLVAVLSKLELMELTFLNLMIAWLCPLVR